MFQGRQNASVDFYRGWQDYKNGFGDLNGNFWLGLDEIYPGPEVFLGLANAKCEKTREEKGKTSGEFVSDSWFG